MAANDIQIGGDHYKNMGGEEHWDRAWRLKYDCFQYIITKWVERWRQKGGVEDLKKAQHAIQKYIEVLEGPEMKPFPQRQMDGPLDPHMYGGSTLPSEQAEPGIATSDEPIWVHQVKSMGIAEVLKQVQPTGWIGFVFEGATATGFLYTCKTCKMPLWAQPHVPPCVVHVCGTEPGRGYVDQG